MQYMHDWIAKEADLLLYDWETIDAILFYTLDEALEAESIINMNSTQSNNDSVKSVTNEGKVDPTEASNKTSRNTSSLLDRIKEFFDNLLVTIDRFFTEIGAKFQQCFVSDNEFIKKLNKFTSGHSLKKDVNVQNGVYDIRYISSIVGNVSSFCNQYNSAAQTLWNDFHKKIMSNTADEDSLKEANTKIQNIFGNDVPLVALGKRVGVKVDNGVNVRYMYNEIHTRFIGETKVISIGANGDPKYVNDAIRYLNSYQTLYSEITRTINNVKNFSDDTKKKIRQIANASKSQFKTANILSQRISEYCKTIQAAISILRLATTCIIEKAVNSRMIIQRAYGFQV